MKIITSRLVEDCFDDSSIYGYEFNRPWDYQAINALVAFGKVEYFAEFPKPFFRVVGANGLVIKGVEGELTSRVIYPRAAKEVIRQQFESFFSE